MKTILIIFFLFSFSIYANDMQKVTESERRNLNIDFDMLVFENCIDCGDVVGNGHGGDVVGNGHGGDVVGNGGGLIEGLLQYYALNLTTYIENALYVSKRHIPKVYVPALYEILHNLKNREKALDIVFVSGDTALSFFTDYNDQQIRAAKTGFDESYPIYINIDYLYKAEELSKSYLLSLLIHEVAHQVGFKGHTSLDVMGSYVNAFSNRESRRLDTVQLSGEELNFEYFNYSNLNVNASSFITFNNTVYAVGDWDSVRLKKLCRDYEAIGFKYMNLSWQNFEYLVDKIEDNVTSISGALLVNCAGPRGEVVDRYIDINLDFQWNQGQMNIYKSMY